MSIPGVLPEFVTDPTTNTVLHGTCGETALAVAEAQASGVKASYNDLLRIYHEMRAAGQASVGGASTLWDLARQAERDGYPILLEWDYQEPLAGDWHAELLKHAGVHGMVIQIGNGQALRDIETGSADEVGLKYHFIAVVNKQSDGYVCADGDNSQVYSGKYEVYNYATLINAVPVGLLILGNKVVAPPPPAPVPAPTPAPVPQPVVPADLHSTLSNLANLLAPFAAAHASILATMKELGF